MSEERKGPKQGLEDVAARQVEDQPPGSIFAGMAEGPIPSAGMARGGGAEESRGYGAGSEVGGAEVWSRVPNAPTAGLGGRSQSLYERAYPDPARGLDREAARRRVEGHPEVMPPHPEPVDRHGIKRSFGWRQAALPALGFFAAGWLLPRFFGRRFFGRGLIARRRFAGGVAAPTLVLSLGMRRGLGRRQRRELFDLRQALRGKRFPAAIELR